MSIARRYIPREFALKTHYWDTIEKIMDMLRENFKTSAKNDNLIKLKDEHNLFYKNDFVERFYFNLVYGKPPKNPVIGIVLIIEYSHRYE